jgi:hypothetical protein
MHPPASSSVSAVTLKDWIAQDGGAAHAEAERGTGPPHGDSQPVDEYTVRFAGKQELP